MFGASVAMSSDGNTAVVGAPNTTINSNTGQGAAYVFTGPLSSWTVMPPVLQTAELTASGGNASDSFGQSVAIDAGGTTVVVGASGANSSVGALYVIPQPGPTWTDVTNAAVTASGEAANDLFGTAVSISGATVAAGAPGNGGLGAAYVDAVLSVTSISPKAGPLIGGTPVTITGTGFTAAATVDFGSGNPASSFTVDSPTQIVATSPPGTGTPDVTVTVAGVSSDTSSADVFTYAPVPTVTGLNPTSGPANGKTTVTITGTNLANASAVDFGSNAATISSDVAGQIVAVSPAGSGVVNVTVTTAGGTFSSSSEQFSYVPVVTTISPSQGPLTGNTTVTITGAGFTSASAVDFGSGNAAISFTINSPTQITATSPAGSPGTVYVTVTTAGETSPPSTNGQFTYVPAPTLTGLTPTAGPSGGGTSVTITGTNLANASAVDFGSNAAKISSDTAGQIVAVSPIGSAGTVFVTVTTAGGTSGNSSSYQFTYVPAPAVTSVTPTAGPLGGGTTVTITGTNLANASAVDFGSGNPATISSDTAGQIVAVSPAGSAGTVLVTVTTAGGTFASSSEQFTYVPPPAVTGVSPTAGPLGGGTSVTITGTNLANASAVDFGNTAASISSDTAGQIVAVSPIGSAGSVYVTVTTAGGTTATSPSDRFTYVVAPTVATPASATPNPVTGTTVSLKVVGADANPGGEASLTYTWAATTLPSGATPPTFSANGTNAAKNTTATFHRWGNYVFTVTIADPFRLTVSSTVSVTVNQTVTTIAVSPSVANLNVESQQQFTATAKDQFGAAVITPTFIWSVPAALGTITAGGLLTTSFTPGTGAVTAASGPVAGSAAVSVVSPVDKAIMVNNDPVTGGSALYVFGSPGNDAVLINPGSGPGAVSVQINGKLLGTTYNPTGRIVIHAMTGNDYIGVSNQVAVAAWLYAGSGNDVLWGGGGPNLLFGGTGNSTLWGGKGRNILIAGTGKDLLIGGAGDGLLIGGTTYYDANDAALQAIMKEWISPAAYATRVAYLTGTPGGSNVLANGSYCYLNSQTVYGSSNSDTLLGGNANDVFFQALGDNTRNRRANKALISLITAKP